MLRGRSAIADPFIHVNSGTWCVFQHLAANFEIRSSKMMSHIHTQLFVICPLRYREKSLSAFPSDGHNYDLRCKAGIKTPSIYVSCTKTTKTTARK